MKNVYIYLILAFSVLTALPSYPQQRCYNRTLASPHQINNYLYGFQLWLLVPALALIWGFSQQHPCCNPLKNSKVSSTLIPIALSVQRAAVTVTWYLSNSHLSHNLSFFSKFKWDTHTHTHAHTRTQHDDLKNLLLFAALQMSTGYDMYHQFNIHKFYVLSTQCVYVFCTDLRTNSVYFPIQHLLTGFITESERVYCAVRTGYLYTARF
jgi:hypothetical protein